MKIRWCWRCQEFLPMLEGPEVEEVEKVRAQCMKIRLQDRAKMTIPELFKPALDLYEKFTGFRETNMAAVSHHYVDKYGPDCEKCGLPLRSPTAAFCASCGWKRPFGDWVEKRVVPLDRTVREQG